MESRDTIAFLGADAIDFECNVLGKLSELANLCRKYSILLGLDSWDKKSMIGDRSIIEPWEEEEVFTDFSNIWVKAIKLMRESGVLERAVWIAPMNEVPHYTCRNVIRIVEIEKRSRNEGETEFEINFKTDKVLKQINHWMGEAIKEEVQREAIPLSYSSLGAENYANRLTDIYDVVDVHFMPDVIMDEFDMEAFEKTGLGASRFSNFHQLQSYNLKEYSHVWSTACQKHFGMMLKRTREYHEKALSNITLDSGKRLIPIVTESFGPCYFPDHKDVDWEWYKNYNADAARIVASLPFAGLSLSNYAEPLFRLWDDKNCHRNSNLFISVTG